MLTEAIILVYKDINQVNQFLSNPIYSRRVKTILVESFEMVVEVIREKSNVLFMLITGEEMFPSSWKLSELKSQNPLLILTGTSKPNINLFHNFLESLGIYANSIDENRMFYKSLTYIEEHLYDNELSLESVAAHIYVSKSHYSRTFQRIVGKGFKQYIIHRRIQKAKMLLDQGYSVTEVCFNTGYTDLTHFSRMFKKVVGENPSQYRLKN
ncbi:helix-turn-helix transcriptional regulator [Bacillus sp. 166amftsu]|uniref:helix-turn-helix transcriptional regulator n=1 Tax=Bacillus sp. 166amftsu TaxID=1761753 RepID=UPI0008996515|nr:helix-turn-helix transcriptional regulator [Bacillus sp. 166amftsu]SDZ40581.1 AraC-type DNA-binding protein [Bacillus sp. 166amftsu]